MIAYALIRIAARVHCVKLPVLRLPDFVGQCLFDRRRFGSSRGPPPVNPGRKREYISNHQMRFAYA